MNRLNESKDDKAYRENGFKVRQSKEQIADDEEIEAIIHESNKLIKEMEKRKCKQHR